MSWISDEERFRLEFEKVRNTAQHHGFSTSPFFPKTAAEFAEHQAKMPEAAAADLRERAAEAARGRQDQKNGRHSPGDKVSQELRNKLVSSGKNPPGPLFPAIHSQENKLIGSDNVGETHSSHVYSVADQMRHGLYSLESADQESTMNTATRQEHSRTEYSVSNRMRRDLILSNLNVDFDHAVASLGRYTAGQNTESTKCLTVSNPMANQNYHYCASTDERHEINPASDSFTMARKDSFEAANESQDSGQNTPVSEPAPLTPDMATWGATADKAHAYYEGIKIPDEIRRGIVRNVRHLEHIAQHAADRHARRAREAAARTNLEQGGTKLSPSRSASMTTTNSNNGSSSSSSSGGGGVMGGRIPDDGLSAVLAMSSVYNPVWTSGGVPPREQVAWSAVADISRGRGNLPVPRRNVEMPRGRREEVDRRWYLRRLQGGSSSEHSEQIAWGRLRSPSGL